MNTAKQVAEYFLSLSDPEIGEVLSNLKLQKLVYYAQGFHLAMFKGKPLFSENILAWEHGPVVEELYQEYKQYGAGVIEPPKEFYAEKVFDPERIDLLNEVYDVYGQFSAWKLRNMTHSEPPWTETPKNSIIEHKLMFDFFSTQLN